MINSVLGLLSQDLALDLGSARTRVYVRGGGVVLDIPSVVAIRTHRSGRKEVIAIGDDAQRMLGRTPRDVEAVRPIRAGRVVAFEAADALLMHIVQSIHGRTGWVRPRLVVAVGQDAPELVHRAVRDSCERVGAREVRLVSKPLAAALGCGLDLQSPAGHMLVDVGAGTTQIAVLCMNEVVSSTTLEIGGDVFDGAILRMLLREHALLVGQPSAERVKQDLAAALEPEPGKRTLIAGRCMRQGVPRMVEVSAQEATESLLEPVAAIAAGIRRVLEQTPPEVASDVVDHGVILTGGASRLRNLDIALRAGTGLAMLPAPTLDHAVVLGAGAALDQLRVLERVAC